MHRITRRRLGRLAFFSVCMALFFWVMKIDPAMNAEKIRRLDGPLSLMPIWSGQTSKYTTGDSPRANGAFYTYIPDLDVPEPVLRTVKSVEGSFNSKYGYDWVFTYFDIDDLGFPEELREKLNHMTSGRAIIEQIKPNNPHWGLPEGIDEEYLRIRGMTKTHSALKPNSKYISYKLKNRFHANGYQYLESVQNYRYVCNVEPGTELLCDVDADFFKYAKDNDMVFGFSYAPVESALSVKTIWERFEGFLKTGPGKAVAQDSLKDFITRESATGGETLNSYCNMDSNMAVMDLDVLRTETYQQFFEHMDNGFGLFYERWTDYNLKTLFLSTYVPKSKIFWIENTGFRDLLSRMMCPLDLDTRLQHGCVCDPLKEVAFTHFSCLRLYMELQEQELPAGVVPKEIKRYRYRRSRVRGQTFETQYSRQDDLFREIYLSSP